MRRKVDDPRPLRLAQQGKCRADAAHHAQHAVLDGLQPLVVGEVFEAARRTRTDRVDEHVQFAAPPLPEVGERFFYLRCVPDVDDKAESVRATATRQIGDRAIESGLRCGRSPLPGRRPPQGSGPWPNPCPGYRRPLLLRHSPALDP